MKKTRLLSATLMLLFGAAGVAAAEGDMDPADPQQQGQQQAPAAQQPADNANQPKAGASASAGANANPSAGANVNAEANATAPTEVQSIDLLFETSSAVLTGDARNELMRLAQWAKCTPHGALVLEGHADIRGTQPYNLKLSAERAAAVRKKLIQMGVPSERIVLTIYGKNGPRKGSLAADRRVTVRATERPVPPSAIPAQT
jgi:outer membrane protein OmpA-like peptidoglycan-associated protein